MAAATKVPLVPWGWKPLRKSAVVAALPTRVPTSQPATMAVMRSRPLSAGVGFGEADRDRRGQRIRVDDGFGVDVVHLEGVPRRRVGERGLRPRALVAGGEQRRDRRRAFRANHVLHVPRPRQRRAVEADADAVEKAQLRALDDGGRDLLIRQRAREGGEIGGGVCLKRRD